jgi:hypothetical protein
MPISRFQLFQTNRDGVASWIPSSHTIRVRRPPPSMDISSRLSGQIPRFDCPGSQTEICAALEPIERHSLPVAAGGSDESLAISV